MEIKIGLIEYLILIQVISSLGLVKFFKAAGLDSWKAFVPVYKTLVLLKLLNKPKRWLILVYIPVVNNVMYIILGYELLHSFNFRKWSNILWTVFTCGLYLIYLGFTEKNLKFVGENKTAMKAQLGSWIPAVFFAVVAATTIRAFSFEAYTIPTPSMEKSLMVGDYLFVSKMHYGPRLPETPLSIPLMHATIPFTDIKCFSAVVQLPYFRLPGFESVQRNESFVFNYPAEVGSPNDKKQNYVKRCVAVAGDTLSVMDGFVYIDGVAQEWPERADAQFSYYVRTNSNTGLSPLYLKENFDINYIKNTRELGYQNSSDVLPISDTEYIITISNDKIEEFRALPEVLQVIRIVSPRPEEPLNDTLPNMYKRYVNAVGNSVTFPDNSVAGHNDTLSFKWSRDEYGPLYIPEKGVTVPVDYKAYLKYYRLITAYEGHTLERKGDDYYIDGNLATSYTFEQNYYWAMGDNRHNSSDSRYWGFVPEDHVVGKPVFIWMSLDKYQSGLKKFRTDRIFTTVHGTGERTSYAWVILLLILGNYGYKKYKDKKKAKA